VQVGVLPQSCLLKKLPIVSPEENPDARLVPPPPPRDSTGDSETKSAGNLEVKIPPESAELQSKQYLAVVGLPTIPHKLANRIWELDFIEMDELLPSM